MTSTSKYKLPESREPLSGALGLAIIPDCATVQRAYSLAQEIMPVDTQYVLNESSVPHITLYHGKLADIPHEVARELLISLRNDLIGQRLVLKEIVAFGGNFIFWNVDPLCSGIAALHTSHKRALSLARYLASGAIAKAVSEEGLQLSEAELENVKLFGHPLVRSLYIPHITLGFQPRISDNLAAGLACDWSCKVESVELVRVGHPGRIEEFIDVLT